MRMDPDNHLVADSLQARWNAKLRALGEVHEQYARRREHDARLVTNEQRGAILAELVRSESRNVSCAKAIA